MNIFARGPPWTQVSENYREGPTRDHPPAALRGIVKRKGERPYEVSNPEVVNDVLRVSHG